jgi:hypothetical protein
LARPESNLNLSEESDEHLLVLRRLVCGLEKDCARIFTQQQAEASDHFQSTRLLALVALAKRRLRPTSLQAGGEQLLSGIISWLREQGALADDASPDLDASAFAEHCCHFLLPWNTLTTAQTEALLDALDKNWRQALGKKQKSAAAILEKIAAAPLTIGWAHEFLAEKNASHISATGLQTTQFFTPEWIADFLCRQSLQKFLTLDDRVRRVSRVSGVGGGSVALAPFTLLDPACGAGHLLVGAINAVMRQTAPAERHARLETLLGHSIHGLDIEPALLDLAAFSIYLTARDWPGRGEDKDRHFPDLPRPRLAALSSPLGSLTLIKNGGNIIDIGFPRHFDAVVMNPPYLSTRTMDDTTADFLKKHFTDSSGDLYTAFIQLAISLLKEGGRLSTIVQQSFLSIARYRDFRLTLLQDGSLISCIQLGTGAFPSRPGEKVNNAILTIEKASQEKAFQYLRLEGKKAHQQVRHLGLSAADGEMIEHGAAGALIDQLSGQPFAFHCPPEVAAIFSRHSALANCGDDFVLTNGLFTCDNKRFVKLTATLTEAEKGDYVPYDKGGGAKWYHRTPHSLFWQNNGQAIRDFRVSRGQSRRLPGEAHYFQPGLTYSYIGTKGFKARLLSPGSIFDIASSAVFSRTYDLNFVLAFFNSALVAYLLSILNPTVNFQIGDLRKLPFKAPGADLEKALATLASQAVELAAQLQSESLSQSRGTEIINEEGLLQRRIDDQIFDHYQVGKAARRIILDETWVKHSQKLNR